MRRVPQDDRDLRSDSLALKCHVAVAVIDKLFVIAVVLFIGVGALVMLRSLIIITRIGSINELGWRIRNGQRTVNSCRVLLITTC